jgi:BolA protein
MTRKDRITARLNDYFNPSLCMVEDETSQHHGSGEETHFKLLLVSDKFKSSILLERHREVKNLLLEEFHNGLHALSLHLFTTIEWRKKEERHSLQSPPCHGGFDAS